MSDCVFCKIIKGELPASKVYEDDEFLAFMDISPVSLGHTLLIPKNHYLNIEDTPVEVLSGLMAVAKKIGKAIKDAGVEGYNLSENNDPVAGQVVSHLHFHIVPRYHGDGLKLWPGRKYSSADQEDIFAKIKQALQ